MAKKSPRREGFHLWINLDDGHGGNEVIVVEWCAGVRSQYPQEEALILPSA